MLAAVKAIGEDTSNTVASAAARVSNPLYSPACAPPKLPVQILVSLAAATLDATCPTK